MRNCFRTPTGEINMAYMCVYVDDKKSSRKKFVRSKVVPPAENDVITRINSEQI